MAIHRLYIDERFNIYRSATLRDIFFTIRGVRFAPPLVSAFQADFYGATPLYPAALQKRPPLGEVAAGSYNLG